MIQYVAKTLVHMTIYKILLYSEILLVHLGQSFPSKCTPFLNIQTVMRNVVFNSEQPEVHLCCFYQKQQIIKLLRLSNLSCFCELI